MSNESQEMVLCSPPRLTRLVVPPREIRFQKEADGQVAPMGNNMSLTSLTAKVAVEQRDQADELNKRKEVVNEMKKSFDRVQNTIESVKREVSAVSRKISLVQDQTTKQTASCKELETGVEKLISEDQTLSCKLSAKMEEFARDQQVYDHHEAKMKNHINLYDHYDSLSTTGQQLKSQEDIIWRLQDELETVAGGIVEEKHGIQEDISHLQSLTLEFRKKINKCQSEIVKEKDRQSVLKRDTELLQRRNTAHLTRLKRQVQEAVARNRQWNEKACHLEKAITEMRSKVNEE